MRAKHGSVLLVTLMFIAIFSILAQQLYRASVVNNHFNEALLQREQAKALALSGISLAIAQLSIDESIDEKKEGASSEKHAQEKKLLRRLLPHLNRMQAFNLKQEIDGIEGAIEICITSEHGKLNINKGFDFEKGEFKDEYKLLLDRLVFKSPPIPRSEILKRITAYLAKRKKPIDDISILREVEGLEKLAIDYSPPRPALDGKKATSGSVALRDIFTVWTDSDKLEPWFLSNALTLLFSLRAPEHDDAEKRLKIFENAIDNFTPDLGKDWLKNWDVLQPVYDKDLESRELLTPMFTQGFAPEVYSVLSWGKIRKIEQKLCAILVRVKKKDASSDQKEKTQSRYIVKRIFWL